MLYNQNPKIALIIIGNEILSGRTLDKNTQYIAENLNKIGVELLEVRVIADDEAEIISAVNLLRKKYDYVFTTGGIGPTHDDITSESIAKAFGVKLYQHPEAYKALENYYGGADKFNPGRLKMTYVPEGAKLIANPISLAPGFCMENVFVLAGVPKIMQAMLEDVLPRLKRGEPVKAKTVQVKAGESKIAGVLTDLQNKYPHVSIGSYPYMVSEDYDHVGTNISFRCVDMGEITKAVAEFVKTLHDMQVNFEEK